MKITPLLKTLLVLAAGITAMPPAAPAAATRVAVLPFQINADKDYTFLQKGIVDMLSSRLSSPTVEVIDPLTTAKALDEVKAFKGESMVLMAAAKLKADFAIHGSITVLGDSVSIDARMLDVTGTRPPLNFFKQTQGMDEVIPQINRLATEINTTVLGRPAPAARPATAPVPDIQPPPAQDIHIHPEKLLQDGRLAPEIGGSSPVGGSGQTTTSSLNPAFIVSAGQTATTQAFWKSRNYQYLFNGLDVGDVNRDGRQETVVVTPQTVMIFQNINNRLQLLKQIETNRYVRNMGVDIADINANGTPEIFVTALTSQLNALSSSVLEFDGRDYKTIDESKWYYRIFHHPAEGDKLLGQSQKAGNHTPLASPIYELAWDGASYVAKNQVLPGNKANLLGTAMGDIMNDGSDAVVAFDADDRLRVLKANGAAEWTDSGYSGGSPLYFAMPATSPGESHVPFYLPVRIRIADLDKDGKYRVIVPRNVDAADRKLGGQRFYKESKIAALQWNGLGLVPAWQTGQISGRIQDLAIADFDNDGADELIAVVISVEGSIIGTRPKSTIIAYELNRSNQ